MTEKFSKGDKVYLPSGRDYTMPLEMIHTNGQTGGAKRWHYENGDEVPEEDFQKLFESLSTYKTIDRNACTAMYQCSYQKLLKTFKLLPTRIVKEDSRRNLDSGGQISALVRIEQIKTQIAKKEGEIAELRTELASLADDGISRLREQLAELEAMKMSELEATTGYVPMSPVVQKEEKPRRIASKVK